MLHVYNTLTRKKEKFIPINPGKIGLYVCGITVYDFCHLGHARAMVCFDVIVRFLREQGYQVTFVRNITDIDDKIIARAAQRKISIEQLSGEFIEAMHEDMRALKILPTDAEPRATQHIPGIIQLIDRLIAKKLAYKADSGDVCFEVGKFPDYGQLSHKDLDGLLAGARVDIDNDKRSPLDFVLWKRAKPGEPSWSSPWGEGRPGWHIECSAMAMQELGEQFDIHGGGLDLEFPHHENEIAQSEGATGKRFANYWLHVGMLQVNYEKMSKSVGNFHTISDVLSKHHPEVVRYFLLSSHYRSSLNYSDANLHSAAKGLTRLYQALKEIPITVDQLVPAWVEQFNAAMNDDFNTPVALSLLFQLSHEVNKTKSTSLAYTLKYLASTLGLLQEPAAHFLQSGLSSDDDLLIISQLIAERTEARSCRNWLKADQIRDQLLAIGVELEDHITGTTWRKV
ncbi:MAG: cysteine--tRNA ligase [Legionella sp.]